MSRMNDLMNDLETLSDYYTFHDKTKAHNRLKQHIQQTEEFMSKLREKDFDIIGVGYWIGTIKDENCKQHCKDLLEFTQSLLNLIKEVK